MDDDNGRYEGIRWMMEDGRWKIETEIEMEMEMEDGIEDGNGNGKLKWKMEMEDEREDGNGWMEEIDTMPLRHCVDYQYDTVTILH